MSIATQTANLLECFPTIWAGNPAIQTGGGLYALMAGLAVLHDQIDQQIQYTAKQARLMTATDNNLEVIASDYLGAGFGRTKILQGTNLVAEDDPSYRSRIQAQVIEEQITIKGIQERITQYVKTYAFVDAVLSKKLLGLDATGSLDAWGALDGQPVSTPPLPQITVFDIQSDPRRAAQVGLTAREFCISFFYGELDIYGWQIGRKYLGRSTFLLTPGLRVIPAPTTALDAYVNSIKAQGTKPVYADDRTS